MPSRTAAIDEFLARLDVDEDRARTIHDELKQTHVESQCRRLRQALIDLGFDHLANWAEPVDGAVSFSDLHGRTAEQLIELLEGVATQARRDW